ncbi:MAG: hypothetical protein Q7R41_05980 [Phycisphaerales bacterium]|nr:hypothetical protein [Phycisphaerales bacterium]
MITRGTVNHAHSNSHFEERGCVVDQPQRADRPEPLGFLNVLRLVEDDTAALRFKMRIAANKSRCVFDAALYRRAK